MGGTTAPGTLSMLDMSAPEFFFTCLGVAEPAGPGLIKFPCCLSDGGVMIPQFYAVTPILRVAENCKFAMQYAAGIYSARFLGGRLIS